TKDRDPQAAGEEVGEERGEGADQGEDEAGEAFVDAAGDLVDPGDEEREAGGVVGARLGGGRADGEAVALVEVAGDRRVGGRVVDGRAAVPGFADPQCRAQRQDRDEGREPPCTAVSRRQPVWHRLDSTILAGLCGSSSSVAMAT